MIIVGRILRGIASTALWVLAVIGVLSAGLWAAHAAGLVQPLIVVSGSMTPTFAKGDLLIATPTPATEVGVGEVASLPNPETGVLVSHRITSITIQDSTVSIEMKGDANPSGDPVPYLVAADDPVWQPIITVPGAGAFIETLTRPAVAVPAAAGLAGLIGLTLIPKPRHGEDVDDNSPTADTPSHTEAVPVP